MTTPELDVLIVSYNVRPLLAACLRSLYAHAAQEGVATRVLVVDNASGDGSPEMVAASFPHASLLRSETNLGFPAGVNLGLRQLGYPDSPIRESPVLLLNPDTEVRPGALSLMLEDLSGLTRAGVIGPGLRYGDGAPQHAAFRFPGLAQVLLEFYPMNWRLTESRLNGRYGRQERGTRPYRCDHPLGAAMLLRPSALQEVGLLDAGFFMYCEEVDWCWRAAKRGWLAWSDPRAIVVHYAGQSASQSRGLMYVELWRSRYRLFAKHRGQSYLKAVRLIVRAGMALERVRARRELRAGRLDSEGYGRLLAAYDAVSAL